MTYTSLEKKIKSLVSKDELPAAYELLKTYFKNHAEIDTILLQSGQFHALKKEQLNGTIDFEDAQKVSGRLRANILSFVQNQKPSLANDDREGENTTIKEDIKLSVARISILWLLVDTQQTDNGLSISEIYTKTNSKSRKNIYKSLEEMLAGGFVEKVSIGKNVFWKISDKGRELVDQFGDTPFLIRR